MKTLALILSLLFFSNLAAQDLVKTDLLPFSWDEGREGDQFSISIRDTNQELIFPPWGFWTFEYPDNMTFEEVVSKAQPGTKAIIVDTLLNGNILWSCHSGTVDQLPLECEWFRRLLEGGLWDNMLHEPSAEELASVESIITENAESLIGSTVRVIQGVGSFPVQRFRIEAISYIHGAEAVGEFSANTKTTVFDVAREHDVTNTDEVWENAITSPQQYLIVTFCGWGPYTDSTLDTWHVWSRYALVLVPIVEESSDAAYIPIGV